MNAEERLAKMTPEEKLIEMMRVHSSIYKKLLEKMDDEKAETLGDMPAQPAGHGE